MILIHSYLLPHLLGPAQSTPLDARAKPTESLGESLTLAPQPAPHPVSHSPGPSQGPWDGQLTAFPMGKAGVACRWAGPVPTSGSSLEPLLSEPLSLQPFKPNDAQALPETPDLITALPCPLILTGPAGHGNTKSRANRPTWPECDPHSVLRAGPGPAGGAGGGVPCGVLGATWRVSWRAALDPRWTPVPWWPLWAARRGATAWSEHHSCPKGKGVFWAGVGGGGAQRKGSSLVLEFRP